MSKKEKAMKTQKEAEVMQIASVPSEEADGVLIRWSDQNMKITSNQYLEERRSRRLKNAKS